MANIRLKLTAITPIHIGSGDVYEPTNFIIDGGVLYTFKDEDFFEKLPDIKRTALLNIATENKPDSFVRLHKFVKENKNIVKEIAMGMATVSQELQKAYDNILGEVRQIEGKGRNADRVFNKFEIQRIQRKQIKTDADIFANTGYIVGSALKGAISTAYQEFIYKKDGLKAVEKKFQARGRDISKNIFKNFKVSDSFVKKVNTKIGYALNKDRFEYDFHNPKANIKLSTYIEIIEAGSEFITDINYETLKIEEILESCNKHYMPIFRSIFSDKEHIFRYLDKDFYEKYRFFELKPNQYLIRVGKHSGARAVTIDGLRDIKSKISGGGPKSKPNKFEHREDETTTWLFGNNPNTNSGLLPFGWVIAEIINEDLPQKEAVEPIYQRYIEKLSKKIEVSQKQLEEKKRIEKERKEKEEQEKAKLASMTPVEKLIYTYSNITVLINDMKAGKIENFEEIKVELAEEIKKILQQNPKTWDKAKKKALDRKNYIETLLK